VLAFALGVPGLANDAVLGALFSMTATGLYSSYMIPVLLRVTISRDTFIPAEFNLGRWSILVGWISVLWALFMLAILCLPQSQPVTLNNLNYSPVGLGCILLLAWVSWFVSARKWFKIKAADIPKSETTKSLSICEPSEPDIEQQLVGDDHPAHDDALPATALVQVPADGCLSARLINTQGDNATRSDIEAGTGGGMAIKLTTPPAKKNLLK
jgi:hypothetical protein